MKQFAKTILCLILCATMIFPCAFSAGAENVFEEPDAHEHEHEHENEEETVASTVAPSAVPKATYSEEPPASEEVIESWECTASPTGKHVLVNNGTIWLHPKGVMLRTPINERYYEASCTHGTGTSSERPCQYCSTWFTVTVDDGKTEATGHSFGDEMTIEGSTSCDGVTYKMQVCETCGYVQVTTEGVSNGGSHTLTNVTLNESVCAKDVVVKQVCDACGAVVNCEDRGPSGHSGTTSTKQNGNCQQHWIIQFKCGRCGYTKDDEYEGNHIYVNVGKKPTCTEPGTEIWECSLCQTPDPKRPQTEVPALGHDWKDADTSDCVDGKEMKCTRCGEVQTVGTGVAHHDWGETLEEAPTCTKPGRTYHICKKCGEEETIDANAKPQIPHEFTKEVILDPATCGDEGLAAHVCTMCGEQNDVYSIPATGEHSPMTDDGDCTTPIVCSVCGQETTPGNAEHSWKYKEIPSAQYAVKQHTKTCTVCKTTETENCSGDDDNNCMTEVKCKYCGSTVKAGSWHVPGAEASRTYIPFEGDEDNYHIALCIHNGCDQPVTATKEAHTYVDGKCTKCDHVHGKEHMPNGIYESDGEYHWQRCTLCGGKVDIKAHDKTETSPYEGDCSKAVTCSVCGHVVREASTHTYDGTWQSTSEYHFRTCTNPGCEVKEEYEHTPVDDHDCTTPNKCRDCGIVLVEGAPDHAYTAAETGHTEEGHKLVCTNEGCDHSKIEAHVEGIAANCSEKAECSICHTKFGELNPDNHVGGEEIRNAKEATEDEEGYTGDTYCLGCGNIIKKGSTIEKLPPSHKHVFNSYVFDGSTHAPACECGYVDESMRSTHVYGDYVKGLTEHSRSCTVCGNVLREAHRHSEDVHDCTVAITCLDCGQIIVPANESHNFAGRAVGLPEGHIRACTNENCDVVSDPVPHTGGSASCQSGAHCEVCDYIYTEKDMSAHVGGEEIRNAKEATEEEEGYTGDTYCLGCGNLIKKGSTIEKLPPSHKHVFNSYVFDGSTHAPACECGYVDESMRSTHVYGDYVKGLTEHSRSCTVCGSVLRGAHRHSEDVHDCTVAITCLDCGQIIVPAKESHNFAGRAVGLPEGHTRACTNENCDVVSDPVKHTGGAASCQDGAHCEVCDYIYTEKDMSAHVGGEEIRNAKEATEEEEGYTGDTYCLGCGNLIKKGSTIEKLPPSHKHVFNSYVFDGKTHAPVCECGYIDEDARSEHVYGKYVKGESDHTRECSVCGSVLREPHRHSEDVHDCTVAITCLDCGQIIVPAEKSHNFSGRAIGLPEGHTRACTNENCDVVSDPVKHTGGAASCQSGAHCEVCAYIYTEKDMSAHVGGEEIRNAKEATEEEEGYTGDTYCLGCGNLIKKGSTIEKLPPSHKHVFNSYVFDGKTHAPVCECGYIDESARSSHVYGDYVKGESDHTRECSVCGYVLHEEHRRDDDVHDCTVDITCLDCGKVLVEGAKEHAYTAAETGHTEKGHKLICTNEGCDHYKIEAHKAGIAANCCEKAECSICHTKFGELNPKNHVGGEEIRNAKEATEEEEGYTGDTYCLGCGKLIKKGSTIEKLPPSHKHVFNSYVFDGKTHAPVCECGYVDESARSSHVYGDYVKGESDHTRECSVCGYVLHEEHRRSEDVHDCTVDITCLDCGKVLVEGAKEHAYTAAETGHTEEGHKLVCTNEGCNQTKIEKHKAGISANCSEKAECSICHTKFGELNPKNHVGGEEIRDAKEATEEEEGYTGDTYCLGCGKLIKKGSTIEKLPPSHKHVFNSYVFDDKTHAPVCECGYVDESARSSHVYGDYVKGESDHTRECSVCGYVLHEEHRRSDDVHDCTVDITCLDCGKVLVEGAKEHAYTAAETGHTEDGHKLVCTNEGCDHYKIEAHKAGIAANCSEKAECSICHTKFGELNPKNHVGGEEIRDAKEATEEEEGYTGDTYCLGCGKLIKKGSTIEKLPPSHKHVFNGYVFDGTTHAPVCECGYVDESARSSHIYGDYVKGESEHSRSCTVCGSVLRESHRHSEDVHDCTVAITCLDCGQIIVPAKESHNFSGRAIGLPEGHVHACTNENCDVVSNPVPHTGGSASCQNGAHCEVCDYIYTEKDSSVHTGGTEIRDQKDPTTTEKGYTGDKYCLGCGALLEKGTEVDKLPEEHEHEFGDWITDASYHWKECGCGAREGFGEHEFEEGVCTVCGMTDPSYNTTPEPDKPKIDKLVDLENNVEATFPEEDSDYYDGVKLVVDKLTSEDGSKYADANETVGKFFTEFVPFDITLLRLSTGEVIQPKSSLTVTIPIPEGWLAGKTALYHVDGTKAETIDVTVSDDGRHIIFTVDHLSLYVLVNTASELTPEPPETGDATVYFFAATAVAVSISGMLFAIPYIDERSKKRR